MFFAAKTKRVQVYRQFGRYRPRMTRVPPAKRRRMCFVIDAAISTRPEGE